MSQRFPVMPAPFPAEVAGHQIMAAIRVPARDGEVPDLALFVGRDPHRSNDRAHVVWDAAFRNGVWSAYSGEYDLSLTVALEEWARRIGHHTFEESTVLLGSVVKREIA